MNKETENIWRDLFVAPSENKYINKKHDITVFGTFAEQRNHNFRYEIIKRNELKYNLWREKETDYLTILYKKLNKIFKTAKITADLKSLNYILAKIKNLNKDKNYLKKIYKKNNNFFIDSSKYVKDFEKLAVSVRNYIDKLNKLK